MSEERRRWLVIHFVSRLIGAVIFAVGFYFLFDLSVFGAALYGLGFAAITASASVFWCVVMRRSQVPPPV